MPRNRRSLVSHDIQTDKKGTENDLIQWMPGGKVAKCKLCANKTMLNQDAVQKHLDSKVTIDRVSLVQKRCLPETNADKMNLKVCRRIRHW